MKHFKNLYLVCTYNVTYTDYVKGVAKKTEVITKIVRAYDHLYTNKKAAYSCKSL